VGLPPLFGWIAAASYLVYRQRELKQPSNPIEANT
jgi:hypothetical protein